MLPTETRGFATNYLPRPALQLGLGTRLRLREQIDRALQAEEGMAVEVPYRETDERRFYLVVMLAMRREQMGEPKEPERPDYSAFT